MANLALNPANNQGLGAPAAEIIGEQAAAPAPEVDPNFVGLYNTLVAINGQDAYSAATAAVGTVPVTNFLMLPDEFEFPATDDADVGTALDGLRIPFASFAAIYVLNKLAAPGGVNAIVFGLLRAFAVEMGWGRGTAEVRHAAIPNGHLATLQADVAGLQTPLGDIRTVAYLFPMCIEAVFRVNGHHWITGQNAEYEARYRNLVRACGIPEIAIGLVDLATRVFHWVTPGRIWHVVRAQIDSVPQAIKIRVSAAPAGTAVIATASAAIESLKSTAVYTDIPEYVLADFEAISVAAVAISAESAAFHVVAPAYGLASRAGEIAAAKALATRYAWFLYGYVEGVLKNAALGQARALKKAAQENPLNAKKSARFFANLARSQVLTIAGLFPAIVVVNAPVAQDDD